MVNPILKNRVKKGTPFTAKEIKQMLEKLLDEKENQKSFSLFQGDSNNYFRENFGAFLRLMPKSEFVDIFYEVCADEELNNLFASLINEHIDAYAEGINRCSYEVAQMGNRIKNLDVMFGGKMLEFYQQVQNPDFNFIQVFNEWRVKNPEIAPEIDDERKEMYRTLIEQKTAKPQDVLYIIASLMRDGERAFIEQNIPNIAEIIPTPLMGFAWLKKAGIDTTAYVEIIETRKQDVVKEMCSITNATDCEQNKQHLTTLEMMLEELLREQELTVTDIKVVGEGGYGRVFKIGEKVVKIGRMPEAYQIPRNSKRFMQPAARFNFDVIKGGRPERLSFEIAELCETSKDFSEEEIYEVYRDIRMQGMVWTDCNSKNLGRLKKDNEVHLSSFKGIKKSHHANVGIDEDNDVEVLPAGELVVIDLDYIFDVNDPNKIVPVNSLYEKFEQRYQAELKARRECERAARREQTQNNDVEVDR